MKSAFRYTHLNTAGQAVTQVVEIANTSGSAEGFINLLHAEGVRVREFELLPSDSEAGRALLTTTEELSSSVKDALAATADAAGGKAETGSLSACNPSGPSIFEITCHDEDPRDPKAMAAALHPCTRRGVNITSATGTNPCNYARISIRVEVDPACTGMALETLIRDYRNLVRAGILDSFRVVRRAQSDPMPLPPIPVAKETPPDDQPPPYGLPDCLPAWF